MSEPIPSPVAARAFAAGDWTVTAGLAAVLSWTTVCLGGYRPETMQSASWGIWALASLGCLLGSLRRPFNFNLAALLPAPFLVIMAASVVWNAPAGWLALREAMLWLQAWLVFCLVLNFVRSRGQARVLVATMALLGAVGAGMAAWQRFHDPSWLMLGRHQAVQFFGRSSGMFGAPNSLAGLLELMIPVCLTLLWSRATSSLTKVLCAWLALVFGAALILTGSRGGWIAVAVALILWAVLFTRGWKARLGGVAVIAAFAFAAVFLLFRFSPQAHDRIQPFLTGDYETTRPIVWRAGLEIWREHPWTGTGAASYNVLFDQHRPRGFLNEPQWAHNDYINTLSDYGLLGFSAWLAAGGAILWLGWRVVRRARRERATASSIFELWRWHQGLWLGLAAFAVHLFVDFHTKIPALIFSAAIAAGLLLRNQVSLERPLAAAWRWPGIAAALGILAFGAGVAAPSYQGEALRYGARQRLELAVAGPRAGVDEIVPAELANLQQAVKIDPKNGQSWADLSWAITLSWYVTHGNLAAIGRRAELAASAATQLCPVMAEFWVRKGVALDMEARHEEADACFRQALALAPNRADWHYAFAYHLASWPERKSAALAEVESCLSLDPGNSAAVSLRDRLRADR